MMFNLMQHYKYSLTELDNMIPFERDIYVDMLLDWIETKKKQDQNLRHE